ncbi:MAG: glycosyl transferase [SAR86 cluster bacterium]|uniref:Glycosyl transferase n=1 Tax=SAR86 cluster bacterium TaxID=2030880 RepID=A0A2A5B8B2_9GAMM|nr:MAG: glycosyl transferase [SAR86 cluster bacterium]
MQDKTNISLSIGIVCFNSNELELCKLIASILDSVEYLKETHKLSVLPIYLIDNSPEENLSLKIFEGYQQRAHELDVELRLLHGHGNIGYGRAHNLPLENLESDYHLILNPDLKIERECLMSGITYLNDNSEVIACSPYAKYENGNKQYLCKRYPSVMTFLVRGFLPGPLKKLFAKRLSDFEMRKLSETAASKNIPIISGCFMLCRTAALKQLNGFDENYFLYFEDFDLSLRLRKLGKIAYVPAMRITHAGGYAAKKGIAHLGMFAKSGIRFFSSHGWRLFRQEKQGASDLSEFQ